MLKNAELGRAIEGNFKSVEGETKVEDQTVQVQMTREQLAEELRKVDELERNKQVNACAQELVEVLNKHQCDLRAQVIIVGDKVASQVMIVVREKK